MILLFSLIILLISILLVILNMNIGMKFVKEREKYSAFECGFDPKGMPRVPFSMHFFLIALIFLIFDVEISLIVPIPFTWILLPYNFLSWAMICITIILMLGALIEWAEKSLNWSL